MNVEQTSLTEIEAASALDGEYTEETSDTAVEKTTEEKNAATEEESTDEIAEKTPETYQITVLGKEHNLTLDQLISSAQKGLDYDRIKSKYDELNALAQQNGLSVADFLEQIKTGAKNAQIDSIKQNYIDEGFDEETASLLAEKDYQLSGLQEKERFAQESSDINDKIRSDVDRLRAVYPDVTEKDLNDQVFEDVSNGMSLIEAYQKQLIVEKEKTIKIKQKEQENKQKSTGSVATVGNAEYDDAVSALMNA